MARTRQPREDHFNVGFRVLQALVRWPTYRGVTQLSKELGLAPSSTHDILKILCDLGFVIHNPHSRKYAPSPQVFEFINYFTTHYGITPRVQSLIARRAEETSLSIYIGTLWQLETYTVYAAGPLGMSSSLGGHGPAAVTAVGKALIAQEPPGSEERFADSLERLREEYAANPPGNMKYYKLPTRAEFLAEIARIRQSGVAWNVFGTGKTISVAVAIKASDYNARYGVAFIFPEKQYYLLDRESTERSLRELGAQIEREVYVKA